MSDVAMTDLDAVRKRDALLDAIRKQDALPNRNSGAALLEAESNRRALLAYVDALRELLRDIRPYVYGLDNIKRIDAALERQP